MSGSSVVDGPSGGGDGGVVRDEDGLLAFWQAAQSHLGLGRLAVVVGDKSDDVVTPPAWSFGVTQAEADAEAEAVLAGRKTATSGPRAAFGDDLPEVGDVGIVLDGSRQPRALVRVTAVEVVDAHDVPAAHAGAELGTRADDAAVERWRSLNAGMTGEVVGDVVLERFELVYPTDGPAPAVD
ncbi:MULTISPECIES: ASCH domain-containing protein [Cellulomonas]|uniref:ASCH domain-containing protein n=1 Tax=Cellulomonas TaxID=1707 RepID=UPI0010A853F3|nr:MULTISPECIES: ASCH domain-containing protein [Cellulomonas]